MKPAKYLLTLLMSASLFTGVAMAQAETRLAAEPRTRIEVSNQVSDTSTPSHVKIERRTTIIEDDDDSDFVSNGDNMRYFLLFSLIALLLIVVLAMASRRRATL